ncbi:MAG: hypothetical protein ACRDOS_04330 [Gaiellaceae bacterium]
MVRALALPLAALTLAACSGGGSDEEAVELDELPRVVLQPEDVPATMIVFDEGRLARADMGPGERADPTRFGREGGWKARYRVPGGGTEPSGPLVVESRVDLFAATDGAEQDFELLEQEIEAGPGERLDPPGIGEASASVLQRQQAVPSDAVSYTITWRQANVTAAVTVQGFENSLELEDALTLARKQERRIARAAGEDLGGAEEQPAAEPRLALVSSEPPSVEGAGFQPGERVTVSFSLRERELQQGVDANANGVFVIDLEEIARDRCNGAVLVRARGERGSEAELDLPMLQCPPDQAP